MQPESIDLDLLSAVCPYRTFIDSFDCVMELSYMNWKTLVIIFLEKFRKLSEDPLKRLTEIGLKEGMTFLDVGCTLGFCSFPAASMVREKGLVYALDINSDFTEYISHKAKKKGIENIKSIAADAQNTGLSH